MHSSSKTYIYAVLAIAVLAGVIYFGTRSRQPVPEEPKAPSEIAGWKTYNDPVRGISFRYPETLPTKYITAVSQDWPPTLAISGRTFACASEEVLNGRAYCVTTSSEGAAGSIYKTYNYDFSYNGKDVSLTFDLQFVQCANYPEPQQSACKSEQATFDVGALVEKMVQTLTISPTAMPSNSGIQGRALLGPVCPVVHIPPDPSCADRPYEGAFWVTLANGVTVEFESDVRGNYTVTLPPGSYVIRNAVASQHPSCSSQGTVVVSSGVYTDATIYCDTGIR